MSARHGQATTARRHRAKRNAWLLALCALGIYAAVVIWHISRNAV